jgi:hypothetical protein
MATSTMPAPAAPNNPQDPLSAGTLNMGTVPPVAKASVSTSAPAAQPSKPVPVVGPQPAQQQVQQMKKTVDDVTQSTLAQDQAKIGAVYDKHGTLISTNQGKAGYDVFGNPVAAPSNTPSGPPTPPTQTPEEQAMMEGQQYIYDASGNKKTQDQNAPIPTGWTNINPTTGPAATVTSTAQPDQTHLYKQFADGTYGSFIRDANGNFAYAGTATSVDWSNAQAAQKGSQALATLMNGGTLPLTADQQAQVAGLAAQWNDAIKIQQNINDNNSGGIGMLMNIRGLQGGPGSVAMSMISQVLTDGASKIADLNSKMLSAIATMKDGFETNNVAQLKGAYDDYRAGQAEKDKTIADAKAKLDEAAKEAAAKEAAAAQQLATKNDAIDAEIRTVMDNAEKGGATPAQMDAIKTALANHDSAAAIQAAAGTDQDPTSNAGMYNTYMAPLKAAGKPYMSAGDFIAAHGYKVALLDAQARASVQATQDSKTQAKLLKTLQSAALSSRSDLGLQTKKVSAAITAQRILNRYHNADGTYSVPPTAYGELVQASATLLSMSGIPTVSSQDKLTQATVAGDVGKMLTYWGGPVLPGTSSQVIDSLAGLIKTEGQSANTIRNKEIDMQSIGLDPDVKAQFVNLQPDYDHMYAGDTSYLPPDEINTMAVTKVADFRATDANDKLYQSWLTDFKAKNPGVTPAPVDIAKVFNLPLTSK